MAVAKAPLADELTLGGETFVPTEIALLWAYDGAPRVIARAVVGPGRGEKLDILERVMRRFPEEFHRYRELRRGILQLERPGNPLLFSFRAHSVGLARVHRSRDEPEPPGDREVESVVLALGDDRTFFAFEDIAHARAWGRRVEQTLGRRPAWTAYQAEVWPRHPMAFHARLSPTERLHGFTDLEDRLDSVLQRERKLRGGRRR